MQRQAAFTGNGKLLKGGLHCHTTRSDGQVEPAEVVRLHAENGYDFLAITDHRFYNYTNFAPETGLLIVPGMEMDAGLPGTAGHCFHHVCIGPAKEDGNGYDQDQRLDSCRVANAEEYQSVLDDIHAHGNMTIYAHPEWSCTPARTFENLKGNFAMEIWNTGCAIECDMDTNAAYWDELLMQGQRIWGVATDDGHPKYHHCKGWVRVNTEKDLSSILKALKNGAFYSSCGPEIYDFRIEDGVAKVSCSPVSEIYFINGKYPNRGQRGEGLTEAEWKIGWPISYVRVCVKDEQGRRAWTNPIFLGE